MEKYQEKKVIGRGNYGTAVLVRDRKSGARLVVKKIPLMALSEKERRDAESECKLLSKLQHPNIVEYIDSFLENETLHLVTQYCELGDLAKLIKKNKSKGVFFSEKQIIDWFIQITMAVDHIHSMNIMHRDLKTGNVFLTKTNVVKLGDFGIARVLDSTLEQANTVVGTPYYMSPEVCENKQYNKKSDLWAMGCILYELCTLNHAFDASNLLGLVFKIVQESYPPIPELYSEALRDLVKRLLSKDPAKRPSCRRIFRLPFIKRRLEELATSSSLSEPTSSQETKAESDFPPDIAVPPPPPPQPNAKKPSSQTQLKNRQSRSSEVTGKESQSRRGRAQSEGFILQNDDRSTGKPPKVVTRPPTFESTKEYSDYDIGGVPSTPAEKIREKRDAAARKREQELREASRQSMATRLEARRRSEQFFQPSAENHLAGGESFASTKSFPLEDTSHESHDEVSPPRPVTRHSSLPPGHHTMSTSSRTGSRSGSGSSLELLGQQNFEDKDGTELLSSASTACRETTASASSTKDVGPTKEPKERRENSFRPRTGSQKLPASEKKTVGDSEVIYNRRTSRTPSSTLGDEPSRPQSRHHPISSDSGGSAASRAKPRSSSTNSSGQDSRSNHTRDGVVARGARAKTKLSTDNRVRSATYESLASFSPTPHGDGRKERKDRALPTVGKGIAAEEDTSFRDADQSAMEANLSSKEDDGYSDDFESDATSEEEADQIMSPPPAPLSGGGQGVCSTRKESGVAIKCSGPQWTSIARKQRKNLEQILGTEPFEKVYSFLKSIHASGATPNIQENQKVLRQLVGSDKLRYCFDIDQLIYIEETML